MMYYSGMRSSFMAISVPQMGASKSRTTFEGAHCDFVPSKTTPKNGKMLPCSNSFSEMRYKSDPEDK